MDIEWKNIIWRQMGASIDTLENAINSCPNNVWSSGERFHQYWYIAFHTIFWLDYYLDESIDNFAPPEPFTMSEVDPRGAFPDRVYTKDELLSYLAHGHEKARKSIQSLTVESAARKVSTSKADLPFSEMLLYVMRHVQHHAAQLNFILRQKIDSSPGWVFQAGKE